MAYPCVATNRVRFMAAGIELAHGLQGEHTHGHHHVLPAKHPQTRHSQHRHS